MRRWIESAGSESMDVYAEWLKNNRPHGELVFRAQQMFDERGPKMPRRLREDLAEFLRERASADLARLVALNDDPRDDREFMAWLYGKEAP